MTEKGLRRKLVFKILKKSTSAGGIEGGKGWGLGEELG